MLWIDGVGAYLVCLGEQISIGGPGDGKQAADVALLANLSRRHATVARRGEGYWLEANGPARVSGRVVEERVPLGANHEIELAGRVRLRFRLPSVLSATAVLDFISEHRPARSVDGVILMDETCLLGPGGDNHVRCRPWSESVILFRKGDGFWCKSRSNIFIGGELVREAAPLPIGQLVTGPELQFRLEPAKA
jgi:hypothetical protein